MQYDVFFFPSPACISKYSAGSIFYYPSFHHIHNPAQLEKLQRDLERYLSRKIGFEAVLRIRCTKGNGRVPSVMPAGFGGSFESSSPPLPGLSIHTFHGNFFVRSTDLLSLANVNPDSAFAVQMSIEDSLADSSLACFQAALLYTSSKGNSSRLSHSGMDTIHKDFGLVDNGSKTKFNNHNALPYRTNPDLHSTADSNQDFLERNVVVFSFFAQMLHCEVQLHFRFSHYANWHRNGHLQTKLWLHHRNLKSLFPFSLLTLQFVIEGLKTTYELRWNYGGNNQSVK